MLASLTACCRSWVPIFCKTFFFAFFSYFEKQRGLSHRFWYRLRTCLVTCLFLFFLNVGPPKEDIFLNHLLWSIFHFNRYMLQIYISYILQIQSIDHSGCHCNNNNYYYYGDHIIICPKRDSNLGLSQTNSLLEFENIAVLDRSATTAGYTVLFIV